MNKKPQIILGIDPGTTVMGYALLRVEKNQPQVLLMDVLKLAQQKDIYARLEMIHTKVMELIKLYQPTTFAIEAPFLERTFKVCSNSVVRKVLPLQQPCKQN